MGEFVAQHLLTHILRTVHISDSVVLNIGSLFAVHILLLQHWVQKRKALTDFQQESHHPILSHRKAGLWYSNSPRIGTANHALRRRLPICILHYKDPHFGHDSYSNLDWQKTIKYHLRLHRGINHHLHLRIGVQNIPLSACSVFRIEIVELVGK